MESVLIVNKRDIEQTNAHKNERTVITIRIEVDAEDAVTEEEETVVVEDNEIIENHVATVAKLAIWNATFGNLQKTNTRDLMDIEQATITITTRTNREMLLETMDPTLSTC
jgi:hypothetical protein